MTANYKVAGIWKQATPYVKITGTWKVAKSAWTKIDSKWQSWFLQGGVLDDLANNTGTGADATGRALAVQSNGDIVFGGSFTTFNGTTVNRIVRLNADGTRDTAFTTNTGTGFNNNVRDIAIQSDGKLLMAGEFTTFNGTTVNRIVRLNADGTRDTAFTTNTGTGFNAATLALEVQSDGKIVYCGGFAATTFNGTTVNYIVRLNADGTRDTAFTTNTGTGFNNAINGIAIQSDGKLVFSGSFTTFNGTTVNRIVRLNADGTRDTAFTTNTGTGFSNASQASRPIAIQSDGKLIVGGEFTTFNGTTVNRIVRLNADGTRDTAFTTNTGTGFDNAINGIAIQSDGKIVCSGNFTTFNGTTVNRIVRLNADGTRDTAFTTNTGTGASASVIGFTKQADGKLLLGGDFTTFNGTTVNRITRIGGDFAG